MDCKIKSSTLNVFFGLRFVAFNATLNFTSSAWSLSVDLCGLVVVNKTSWLPYNGGCSIQP